MAKKIEPGFNLETKFEQDFPGATERGKYVIESRDTDQFPKEGQLIDVYKKGFLAALDIFPLNDTIKNASVNAEYAVIMKAMSSTGNNKTKAAKLLGIDRKTLYNKMKAFKDQNQEAS